MGLGLDTAPILAISELERLCAELNGDQLACRSFVLSYCARWDARFAALEHSVTHSEVVQALDAVLSIKTSSAMIGGLRLHAAAAELEAILRDGADQCSVAMLQEISRIGALTVTELTEYVTARLEP